MLASAGHTPRARHAATQSPLVRGPYRPMPELPPKCVPQSSYVPLCSHHTGALIALWQMGQQAFWASHLSMHARWKLACPHPSRRSTAPATSSCTSAYRVSRWRVALLRSQRGACEVAMSTCYTWQRACQNTLKW